ncbi:MAG: methyltransferase domain-containing protein [Candidatus Paceibacterota bacterium]
MNIYLKKFIDKKFKIVGKSLDLGAGNFFDVACLKQLGWKSKGVDLRTGIDLEKRFISKNKPFDLIYSNYVIHKIKNKKQFIKTIYVNLKEKGWLFIHTFDKTDVNSTSNLSSDNLQELLEKQGFKKIKIKVFKYYDNEDGHKHWHKILEATAQKLV